MSERNVIKAIKGIAWKGYEINQRKAIQITLGEHQMRYIPDVTLKVGGEPHIIIEVEGADKVRKVLIAEIVLAGLAGTKHFIGIAKDRRTADYIKRYGIILTSKIKEIEGMKVSSVFVGSDEEVSWLYDLLKTPRK